MSNSVVIRDNLLHVTLEGEIDLSRRLAHVDRLFSIINHKFIRYLYIKVSRLSLLNSLDEINQVVEKIRVNDWKLRQQGRIIKIAVKVARGSLDEYSRHIKVCGAKGVDNLIFFDSEKKALTWLDIESDLTHITAFFQPIVTLDTGEVEGYEALARKVIDNKIVPINQWLPFLLNQKNGSKRLASKILLVIKEKLKNAQDSQYISLNMELSDLNREAIDEIMEPIQSTKYNKRVVLEVCEREEYDIDKDTMLRELNESGVRIAIDDLGAGASRLLSLIDLSPELIKLDISVVHRMNESKVVNLVKLLINWANINKVKIIAEGIETKEQAERCRKVGISFGQGFFFAKPEANLVSTRLSDERAGAIS